MPDDELGRVRSDLDVMRQAMGLHLPFGREVLVWGAFLATAAFVAALFGLLVDDDRLQMLPFAVIMVIVPFAVFLWSRRTAGLNSELTTQVMVSISIHAVVWVAGTSYAMAAFAGSALGFPRMTGLYAAGVVLLLVFSWMLVSTALSHRERRYCLGLTISTLLAATLFPLMGRYSGGPSAHCFMAIGYLAAAVIQWSQLREVAANRAAD
jgi:hypothetical protein